MSQREPVVVLSSDSPSFRLLQPADVHLHFERAASRVITSLQRTGAAVLLVPAAAAEGCGSSAAATEALISELRARARAPQLLIVALCECAPQLADLRQIRGETAVIDLTSPGAATQIAELVQHASQSARLARAAAAMTEGMPPSTAWLVRQFVERAFEPLRLAVWVSQLPISRATANRRVRVALGMSLERAMIWGRVLAGIVELEHTVRRVADVAFDLGYEDATGLTQACRARTGLTPRELVRSGGVVTMSLGRGDHLA